MTRAMCGGVCGGGRIARNSVLSIVLMLMTMQVAAQTGERIIDYAIGVQIHRDGALDVTETIVVQAEGNRIRRGIYRDFPTRYRDRHGNNVVVGLEVLSVQRNGFTEPWFSEARVNGVRINTGSDELLPDLPAQVTYTLRYRTTRQIGFFDTHDELYWNAIGTGWEFDIIAGSVQVSLPEPVPVEQMELEGYTGLQGASGQAYTADAAAPGIARWQLTAPLAPREGLTIVISFPKGIVEAPGATQRMTWLLADNRGVLVAFAGLLLLLGYTARRWYQVGRDPRPGVIFARYFPPQDRSPAELRFLLRRRYDTRCFTSDLLLAAVHGQISIERTKRMLRSDLWQLRKSEPDAASDELPLHSGQDSRPPSPGEDSTRASSGAAQASLPAQPASVATLIAGLFSGGSHSLELAKKNASLLQLARKAHAKVLDRRLHGSHFRRNIGSVVVAAAIVIVSGFAAFAVSGGSGVPLIAAIEVSMVIVVVGFAILVQAPTLEGRKLMDEIEGLRRYLGVAERDELASMAGPATPPTLDARRYEMLLPYAVALDVEDAWTRKFTLAAGAAAVAEATRHIAWYRGAGVSDLGSLAKAVGSGLSTSIASASTPPGSSSGRGGGGFSGGGGGGGGGGGR